ncbi:MAG TPA: AbfB domain-containing protein [Amycolatopsis sp.]|uniref:AbfB domain-containing protein n=1 Tax=Amycolatopsis nalaikhensis TaxID=715472 RepID=A0ABY8XZV7_9PSEU|nr:AbfB domain-containing protein [Amycolatopsis sp. 2-2]WIV61081.1 AbfB domain-containing protein [Amycolatopsis sp. 2-2]
MPENTMTWNVSIRSANFPKRYVRHRDFLVYLDEVSSGEGLPAKDASFKVVPGLADTRLVSFTPVTWSGYDFTGFYLRHQDFRLKLDKYTDGDRQFAEDATFELVPSVGAAPGAGSLYHTAIRAYNLADHYLRHANYELWLGPYESNRQFWEDSSFDLTGELAIKLM